MSPNCSMNCSKRRVEGFAAFALLEHAVQGIEGVAHPGHLLGVGLASASDMPWKYVSATCWRSSSMSCSNCSRASEETKS